MARAGGKISAKYALSHNEIEFCKIFVAFGLTNHTEAYRRSFLTFRADSTYCEAPVPGLSDDELKKLESLLPKEINRRAKQLLKQDYIQAYLTEIARPAGEHARSVLADQARFAANPGDARRAAEQILASEDKLGFRDAVEHWAEIMCEIGAEIEVPLPAECPHCGKGLYAAAPMSEMFPKLKGDR